MKKLILMLFLIPTLLFAQNKGVKFEHGLNWTQIQEKAAKENKFIFVDCFTTWCGPCKYMSNTIFPQAKVGDFFNAKFINAKIQMDKTDKDNEEVKSWYQEADRFAKDYNVRAYPTFLIFDTKGNLVHRIVGGGEADDFIAKARKAFDPNTQYETLLAKFNADPNNLSIAKSMAQAAKHAYDQETQAKAEGIVLTSLPTDQIFTKEYIELLLSAANVVDSKAFNLIKDNQAKFDAVSKKVKANDFLSQLLIANTINTKISAKEAVDFTAIEKELAQKYPTINTEKASLEIQPRYFSYTKNYPGLRDSFNKYIAKYGSTITAGELNNMAWSIFENCDDPACLKAAAEWSKLSLEKEKETPMYLDTFANILYRLGEKEKAIKTQEKAISLLTDATQKEEYVATLQKMKKGEKTWQ
ncbi:thioredoxin fold domain-containing protein [Sphingobacterium sp.]|uniref:thioredoxin family protein n=1 Tax=Sphingobacterium sp. TaxID=341027 RepID=UPI00289AEE20|nr:thioredoxin fold domain-containing protein [Sphingobacterium sp.]